MICFSSSFGSGTILFYVIQVTEYLYLGVFQLISLNLFKGKGFTQEWYMSFVNNFKMGGIKSLGSNLSPQC